MEPVLDQLDDDAAYLARREQRRKRMLREKQRRQKRRRMIVLLLCLVVVFALSGVVLAKIVKNKKEIEPTAQEKREDIKTEVIKTPDPESSNAENEEAKEEKQPETVAYTFKETENTKGLYSDAVISTHALLINESTDTIVAWKGARERISPASMTKVLTLLVAAEHVSEQQLDDTFTMTIDITDYSYVNDCSNVGFLVDEKIPVIDLFYGTILPSGGDAAVGLATYVAGSHEAFVDLMNRKLEALGLSDSAHFTNCVGLYDDDHYCTIYDMAVIMKAALQNELCRKVLAEKCYTTTPTEQHPEGIIISNWFLRRIEDKETGGEVLGAKTGYVNESGSCAVSYQVADDGTPYICVTAGSSSSWRCIYDHVEIYNQYIPTA